MGSDRARVSYDEQRRYRAVIMQQGRVTVEADWNEEWQIINEEIRKEVLDIVGPCGTPDDGYRIVEAGVPPTTLPYDFAVTTGTMYVGGMRTCLPPGAALPQNTVLDSQQKLEPNTVLYSQQKLNEWIDQPTPLRADTNLKNEFIYLSLREQEVSAVEDYVLREVALGGPDTAQRLRLVQRIMRMGTDANDCETALAGAVSYWASMGYNFIDHDNKSNDMRLIPSGTLQVSFQNMASAPDPCEPQANGGYLRADNQLIRVQISYADPANKSYRLLWGYDNASFLYRVSMVDNKTLKLATAPLDDFHKPRQGQAVEVLCAVVKLDTDANDTTDYMAAATGFVTTLQANYDPNTGYVSLNEAIPAEFSQSPVLFLRVWEEEKAFSLSNPVILGDAALSDVTGLQVTIQVDKGDVLGVGTYWLFAVRPNTPTEVYPHRYLESPQPPDGPRIWVCPLGVITWQDGILQLLADCRNHFDNLVDLSRIKQGGCCTVSVRPEDLNDKTLQDIIDQYKGMEKITVCLMPGVYNLVAPLRFGSEHSNLTLEACHDGAVLQAAQGKEADFADGLIVLNRANNVTLHGLRFELPLVPLGAGAITHLMSTQAQSTNFSNFSVSIGIRPLHCALLTITNCLFRFALGKEQTPGQKGQNPSTPAQSVFGVGIFAGSECWGLTVRGNRFVHEEDFLRSSFLQEIFTHKNATPFRLIVGYLLAPTTIFGAVERKKSESLKIPSGTLVRPLLQDASFQDNLFSGLSIAALIYSDMGVVKFERNTVRDCYAGFWLLSLRSLAFAAFIDEVMVSKTQLNTAQILRASILSVVLDPLIQIGSVLARSYPLPKEFDVSHAVQQAEQKVSPTAAEERQQIQTLITKALALFREGNQEASTSATEAVNIKEGVTTANAATLIAELKPFSFQQVHLSNFERAVFLQKESKHGLHLSLHISDNDIDATISNVTSGIALLVWDDEWVTASMVTMNANKIRNCTPSLREGQQLSIATALVIMAERCAITGNLILNEERVPTSDKRSLIFLPGGEGAEVAITGNVLQGTPLLPPRQLPASVSGPVPYPMNTWEFLNTAI